MVETIHKTGPWLLSDLESIEPNGFNVMSCFHCGGGSTMGYKLSGFNVLGGVEIDKEMSNIYILNHHPKYQFNMGIKEFNKLPKEKIPTEFFNLDILDGSPPCSSFSMAGSREKKWGKEKKFREGQALQVLDDLFFHFVDTARRLQPKVVVAENVTGLVKGKARGYVKEIAKLFELAGYDIQIFLLNAAFMGVPQKRERIFFIAKKKSLNYLPKLNLEFKENPIVVSKAFDGLNETKYKVLTDVQYSMWSRCSIGNFFSSVHPKGSWFNSFKLDPNKVANTVTASAGRSAGGLYHWCEPRQLSPGEYARLQTFPDDYKVSRDKLTYICGMSVPPYMMNRISKQIELQWLNKIGA